MNLVFNQTVWPQSKQITMESRLQKFSIPLIRIDKSLPSRFTRLTPFFVPTPNLHPVSDILVLDLYLTKQGLFNDVRCSSKIIKSEIDEEGQHHKSPKITGGSGVSSHRPAAPRTSLRDHRDRRVSSKYALSQVKVS